MRVARSARLAGTALGALTVGAVLFPAPLGAGLRPPSASDPVVWADPFCEPGPPGWVQRVDERLELRMPALGEGDRRTLARTLVVEAESARIDPLLVLALIEIESSYDPAARSGRGALGLMQLREPTLRREVERAGLELLDPHDPATNLRAGIRYLRRLLDAFGREDVALMAYNAGPNRILGYLREGEGEIPARFHAYPRKVRAELRRLRRTFAEERQAALAAADPVPLRGGDVAPARALR
jgi:soluble lytic murein transglycosylase-like protein